MHAGAPAPVPPRYPQLGRKSGRFRPLREFLLSAILLGRCQILTVRHRGEEVMHLDPEGSHAPVLFAAPSPHGLGTALLPQFPTRSYAPVFLRLPATNRLKLPSPREILGGQPATNLREEHTIKNTAMQRRVDWVPYRQTPKLVATTSVVSQLNLYMILT